MGTSPKRPCDVKGGQVFSVAGGETSEFSLLLRNLAWADLVVDLGNWVEGGGVIVLVARTGEPSLGGLVVSVGPSGLDKGVASPRRIADSSIGVRGVVISDMLAVELWHRKFSESDYQSVSHAKDGYCLHEPTSNSFDAA